MLIEGSLMPYSIEPASSSSLNNIKRFLEPYKETCLFLLSNIDTYGLTITQAPHSGNVKIIYNQKRDTREICAVFSITRLGTLLIQSSTKGTEELFKEILSSCSQDGISIKTILGEWSFCKELWDWLLNKNAITEELCVRKDPLYSLHNSQQLPLKADSARFLVENDYVAWRELNKGYEREQRLVNTLPEHQVNTQFIERVRKKIIWGLFSDSKLISVAELNAKTDTVGQVGGVFTHPSYRNQGFAKRLLDNLIHDCFHLHGLTTLILFTNEENIPAQKVYQSLGFSHIGYFAILCGR